MATTAEPKAPDSGRPKAAVSAWYRIGWPEAGLVLSAAGWTLTRFRQAPVLVELLVLLATLVFGGVVTVKVLRKAVPPLLWKLRNRLIVAYIMAVLPILILLLLAASGCRYLGGQIAVYLVQTELGRRLNSLNSAADTLARQPEGRRQVMLERVETFYREQFPGLEVLTSGSADAPPSGWGEAQGIVARKGLLHAWARAVHGDTQVTLLFPLTRRWLSELTPELGDVSIVHFSDPGSTAAPMRLHPPALGEEEEAPLIAPAVNRFDIELLWAAEVPVAIWESPDVKERSLLAVHSRLSMLLGILFTQQTPVPTILYTFVIAFLVLLAASLFIGVSITRTITGAVHDLYEGTERVMRGDFSHRIKVRGKEQIAELSRSFNRMTENLENLLAVAKEKERMQAELEIAREVQNALFPRVTPALARLELRALCNPALMVSGDYYEYQSLGDGKVALAIGDVAGKGISAALLMATLQASLRSQARELREASVPAKVCTATVVSRINLQLYADTAPEKYATFFFGVYDDESGLLTYTNAGHLPPLLVRHGEVQPLEVNGMVVGAFPFAKYDESTLRLVPGDLLVCYTDGVVEPENEFGEMFGEEQLREVLVKSAHLDAEQILGNVLDAVQRHTGSPEMQDDLTILLARRS